MELILSPNPPFSVSSIIRSHGWVQLAPFSSDGDYTCLVYVDRLASGRVVELRIREALHGVVIQVDEPLSEAEGVEVTRKATWVLGLEQDFSAFYALARGEPKLAGVESLGRGRVLRCPTLFEDTVKTILTTNTAWGGTKRMVTALVSQFGDPLPDDPGRSAFPTPAQIAALDEETLRGVARLGYRSPYILELARVVDSGDLDLEALKTADLSTDELRKRLLVIKGVGGYAAANLLVILGRYDDIPVDSWARTMVSHEWYDGQPVGAAEIEAAFERWGEWKGLAYWFWDWSYGNED